MTSNKPRTKIILTITSLALALIWLSPFYLMLVNAFKTKFDIFSSVLSLPSEWQFDNFIQAFNDLDF